MRHQRAKDPPERVPVGLSFFTNSDFIETPSPTTHSRATGVVEHQRHVPEDGFMGNRNYFIVSFGLFFLIACGGSGEEIRDGAIDTWTAQDVGSADAPSERDAGLDASTIDANTDAQRPDVSVDPGEVRAFPGAEGFGRHTQGGRGGQVYEVTNLNDSGPGSFREACEASGPRTVVFRVGGRIDITGPTIKITHPYITIAGQTAPGDGIMITREGVDRPALEIDADEVIIRYLRFRRSTSRRSGNNPDNVWVNSGNNLVFDHCSFAWASDGNLDIANYDGQPGRPPEIALSNITVQYTIFTNPYGGNNKNHLVSRGPTGISWFRNAWLSTATRNPSISTPVNEAPTWDCYYEHVNNFHYDYTNGPSYNNNDPGEDTGIYYVNVIANWAKENNNDSGVSPTVENSDLSSRRWLRATTVGNGMAIFVRDNITPYRPNDSYDEWAIGQNGGGQADRNTPIPDNLRGEAVNDTPILTEGVPLWEPTDIWANLRTHVGASLPTRDSEDARAIRDVDTGESTEHKTSNTFPVINGGTPYVDTDSDGMADDWEVTAFGTLERDGTADADGNGYTDLEEFLNHLTAASR